MITIDEEICTQCNTCHQHCPHGVIVEGPEIDEEVHSTCIDCGHCVVVCPSGAISLVGYEDLEIPPYTQDLPVSSGALETLLRKRRSVRHYKPEPVSKEHLEKIIQAASLVPTGNNWQAFKAYVCTRKEVISQMHRKVTQYLAQLMDAPKNPIEGLSDSLWEELRYAVNYLAVNPPEGRDSLFWNSSTLLVFATNLPPVFEGDTWIASFAAVMYAETIPVGTCYNGLLTFALNGDPSIKQLLNMPKEELAVAALTLGYPDEEHFRYPPRRTMQINWV
jgi:nitroreductase/NAD-dependent dihydropyrimidine dehydrogenase PreA subunit